MNRILLAILGCLLLLSGPRGATAARASSPTCTSLRAFNGPSGSVSVMDTGAVGDGGSDDTAAIQCAIDVAAATGVPVWFPSGIYRVSSAINLRGALTLAGQTDSVLPAILRASAAGIVLGDPSYNGTAGSHLTLKDLFFDGVSVRLHGPWSNVAVQRDGFSDSNGLLNYAADGSAELGLLDVKSATVSDSIFLHGNETTDAVPLHLYSSAHVTVTHNVVGADLGQLAWLSSWPGYAAWADNGGAVTAKLAKLQQTLSLGNDQGQFRTGLYAEQVSDVAIDANIINGSPDTQGKRDHAAYLWGKGSGTYTQNWVRGWPAAGDGGIKVRNGSSITVGANNLIDTGILTYVYNDFSPYSLDHVTLCDNRIEVAGGSAGDSYAGIMYWQDTAPDSLSDIVIYGNRLVDDTHKTGISLSNGKLSAFTIYTSNTYQDTGATVALSASPTAPSAVSGSPDSGHAAQCAGLAVPSYSIPSYSSSVGPPVFTVTAKDAGQTVHVPVGARVVVKMRTGVDTSLEVKPPGVLVPVTGSGALAADAQGTYEAAQPGTATLTATERPDCSGLPGAACPDFVVNEGQVTVVVDPLAPLLATAGESRTAGAPSPAATVTGTVTSQEPITLPSNATLWVLLRDLTLSGASGPTRPDTPAITIDEQQIDRAGQMPIPFRLTYDPAAIDPTHTYAVLVSLMEFKSGLLFTNTRSYPVITQGNPTSNVQVMVAAAGGASFTSAVTGMVTSQEPVTLSSDAMLSILLEDVALQDAPALVIGEQIISPAGQLPVPFRVAYDPTAIDPKHTYTLQVSIMDGSGQLLFTNMELYPVITQGNPTSDFRVLVGRV